MVDDDEGRFSPQTVSHPGEMVNEYLESYEWSQQDLARRSGLTAKTVSEICNCKAPISPVSALALENVFSRPAHFWLNLQRLHDESSARTAAQSKKLGWSEWAQQFPIREMKSLQLIPEHGDVTDSVLRFFGVASPDSWRTVFNTPQLAFRQSQRLHVNAMSVSVWIRATEIRAAEIDVAPFDAERLRSSLSSLRSVSRARPETWIDATQDICARAGVAVVWMPALKSTGISGCARWLSERKALIALTLRYKTDDQLWFTFFHELGHVLLHRKRNGFILDQDEPDDVIDSQVRLQEDEADRFSADTLIPPAEFSTFVRTRIFNSEAIYQFAERIDIAPGVVVGRLQKDGYLAPSQGNRLKHRLDWHLPDDTVH